MPETAPTRRKWLRRLLKAAGVVALGVVGFALIVLIDGWAAIGKAPEGARRARMEASAQWADGVFENPQPLWNDALGSVTEGFGSSAHASPEIAIAVKTVDKATFATPPGSGLRVTWLGHSTLLLEIDGHRFLTDPVWGERTSPVSWLGPQRWYAPPLAFDDLPEVDAVLISHDHYDHLDYPTIVKLAKRDVVFVAPLGVAAHLEYWGVAAERIHEVDWWDEVRFGDLVLTTTPARHASGRQILDQNRTLWASYALVGSKHRVYFSGDTGLFGGFEEIGERLGPFDLTMFEVGAYGQAWPDWHLGPEQAVRAHGMVRGKVLLPIHWGLFDLAFHGWTAPIERALAAAQQADVRVLTPRPGESVEPESSPPSERWWPEVPWQTAEEYPIVATKVAAG